MPRRGDAMDSPCCVTSSLFLSPSFLRSLTLYQCATILVVPCFMFSSIIGYYNHCLLLDSSSNRSFLDFSSILSQALSWGLTKNSRVEGAQARAAWDGGPIEWELLVPGDH